MIPEIPKPTKLHFASAAVFIGFCMLICAVVVSFSIYGRFRPSTILVFALASRLGYSQYSSIARHHLAHTEQVHLVTSLGGTILMIVLIPVASVVVLMSLLALEFLMSLFSVIIAGGLAAILLTHATEHSKWSDEINALPEATQNELREQKFTLREMFLLVTVVALILAVAKLLPTILPKLFEYGPVSFH